MHTPLTEEQWFINSCFRTTSEFTACEGNGHAISWPAWGESHLPRSLVCACRSLLQLCKTLIQVLFGRNHAVVQRNWSKWYEFASSILDDAHRRLGGEDTSVAYVSHVVFAGVVACRATWRGLGTSNTVPSSRYVSRADSTPVADLWKQTLRSITDIPFWLWGCQRGTTHEAWAAQEQHRAIQVVDWSVNMFGRANVPTNLELATMLLLVTNMMHRATVALGAKVLVLLPTDSNRNVVDLEAPAEQGVEIAPPKLLWESTARLRAVDDAARAAYAAVADFLGVPTAPNPTTTQESAAAAAALDAATAQPVTSAPPTHTTAVLNTALAAAPSSAASVHVMPIAAAAQMTAYVVLEPVAVKPSDTIALKGAAAEEPMLTDTAAPIEAVDDLPGEDSPVASSAAPSTPEVHATAEPPATAGTAQQATAPPLMLAASAAAVDNAIATATPALSAFIAQTTVATTTAAPSMSGALILAVDNASGNAVTENVTAADQEEKDRAAVMVPDVAIAAHTTTERALAVAAPHTTLAGEGAAATAPLPHVAPQAVATHAAAANAALCEHSGATVAFAGHAAVAPANTGNFSETRHNDDNDDNDVCGMSPQHDERSLQDGVSNTAYTQGLRMKDHAAGQEHHNTTAQPGEEYTPAGQLQAGFADQPTVASLTAQLKQLQASHDELRAAMELGSLSVPPCARARGHQPRRVITLPDSMTLRQAWRLYCCGDADQQQQQEPWMNLVHDSSVQLMPLHPAAHFRKLMRAVMQAVVELAAWHDHPTPDDSVAMLRHPQLPETLLGSSKVALRTRLEDSAWITVRKHLPVLQPNRHLPAPRPPGPQHPTAEPPVVNPPAANNEGGDAATDRAAHSPESPHGDGGSVLPAATASASRGKKRQQTTEAPKTAAKRRKTFAQPRRAGAKQMPTKAAHADAAQQGDAAGVVHDHNTRASTHVGAEATSAMSTTAAPVSKSRKSGQRNDVTEQVTAAAPLVDADVTMPGTGTRTGTGTAAVDVSAAPPALTGIPAADATNSTGKDAAAGAQATNSTGEDAVAGADATDSTDEDAAAGAEDSTGEEAAAGADAMDSTGEDAPAGAMLTTAASGDTRKRRTEEDHQGASTRSTKRTRDDIGGTTIHCAFALLPPQSVYLKKTVAAIDTALHVRFGRRLHVVSPDGDCTFHTMSFFSGIPQHLLRWTGAVATAIRIGAANMGAGADAGNPMDCTGGAAAMASRDVDEAVALMAPFYGLPDPARVAINTILEPRQHVDGAVLTVVCRILRLHVAVLMVADEPDSEKWNVASLTGTEAEVLDERVYLVVFYAKHYSPCVLETPVEAALVPTCLGFPQVVEVLCADVAALPPVTWSQQVPGRFLLLVRVCVLGPCAC